MALHPHTMVTAVFLPFLLGVVVVQANSMRHFQLTPRFSDASFTNHVLVPFRVVRSRLGCLRNCATRAACKAITYNPGTRSCQQYSVRMEPGDPFLFLRGAQTFIFPIPPISAWLGTGCGSNTNCVNKIPEPELYQGYQLPICFSYRCQCILGHIYSVSTKLCVTTCPRHELQQSYSAYIGAGVQDHNDYLWYGSPEQCMAWCAQIYDCENVEREASTNKCQGSRAGNRGLTTANSGGWIVYLKNCI